MERYVNVCYEIQREIPEYLNRRLSILIYISVANTERYAVLAMIMMSGLMRLSLSECWVIHRSRVSSA